MSDLQPDTGEVLQEEAPEEFQAVPVCVKEVPVPVRVQALPRKGGSTRTRSVTDVRSAQVLEADHRRYSAVLVADQEVYIGYGKASKEDLSTMSRWPANVPFTCTATVDVFVRATTGTAVLSVTTETWAEG